MSDFADQLLHWFAEHGRKDLPWQKKTSAYRVWVSEIMLQQTQVNTVIPYYLRFMEAFPDVQTLSAASEDRVLHYWTGLGYYARARNLHRAAKQIVADFGGEFPDRVEHLCDLPGIGQSTAGAIVALACGKRAPILDGNVKRVLTRCFAIEGWPETWSVPQQQVPRSSLRGRYQALAQVRYADLRHRIGRDVAEGVGLYRGTGSRVYRTVPHAQCEECT